MTLANTDTVLQKLCDIIPEDEFRFTFTRSSGPGGQNVNKTNTRVTLFFDLAESRTLTTYQKRRIRERLCGRISARGILRVVSQRHRTQRANRAATIERFFALVAEALTPRKPRRSTTTPAGVRRRRLADKRRRGEVKRLRGGGIAPGD